MPDEDKSFGGSLVLDFRKWWRHMKTIYTWMLQLDKFYMRAKVALGDFFRPNWPFFHFSGGHPWLQSGIPAIAQSGRNTDTSSKKIRNSEGKRYTCVGWQLQEAATIAHFLQPWNLLALEKKLSVVCMFVTNLDTVLYNLAHVLVLCTMFCCFTVLQGCAWSWRTS